MSAKRYMLFGGPSYYAGGGMSDLLGVSDDLESLVPKPGTWDMEFRGVECEWWHIVDRETLAIVRKGDGRAYGQSELGDDYLAMTQ